MLGLSGTGLVNFYKSGSVMVMHEVLKGRDDSPVEISGQ